MKKIVFIGGGSAKFVREVAVDMFLYPELGEVDITLMDIDLAKAQRSEQLLRKIIAERGVPARVSATDDQRRALEGADYVVVTIMVGGFKHYKSDGDIPAKYGVLQSISDTMGPGGVFRTVRTSPVLRELAKNLREVAPHAWVLNYANPMAMNVWTLLDAGWERTVGLCHSIQWTVLCIADWLGIPQGEIHYTAGGINHVDFYLTLEHEGRDVYPLLREAGARLREKMPEEAVRFELLKYLDYFVAEGAPHQSEYSAWFRKNQAAADVYHSETFLGYKNDSENARTRAAEIEDQIAGRKPIQYRRSFEYAADIIHSFMTGTPRCFYGNVRNRGLIENLPAQAVVEVPCLVDQIGIRPCRVGRIPPQLAAVMMPHISLHELAVTGAARKDRRLIRQAIQADPLTAAICTLPQIEAMVGELFEENAEYTKDWVK
jgi:alpha-galactosidase